MGIISILKLLAPLSFYLIGIVAFLFALAGKVRWTLLVVAFLLPLRNVVERMHAYPMGSQYLDLLIFAMIIGWFLSRSSLNMPLMQTSAINGSAIGMVFYLFISVIIGSGTLTGQWMVDPGDQRVQDWKNFCLLPALFFITANNLPDRKWVWRIFWVMCAAMLLMGYYTTTQIAWYSSLESRTKISGTFQFLGPNEVAAFLNQYTIILMSMFFFMKKGKPKLALMFLIFINTYCILFLFSRGAYLAFGLGMFILFLIKKRVLLIPLVLVVLLWQTVLPEKAIERIKGTTDKYGELDESSLRRIKIWEKAIEMFSGSPIVGIGFGVFRYLGLDLGDTHNIYVKILVEQGIVGLLAFLAVVFSFMSEGYKLYQKGDDGPSQGLGLGLFIAMIVLMVNNFFGDRWSYFELSGYLWIYGGLITRLNSLKGQENPQSPSLQQNNNEPLRPSTELGRKRRKSYYK